MKDIDELIKSICYQKYEFVLTFEEATKLPGFKGGILRGFFGTTMKETFCIQSKSSSCHICPIKETCPYCYLFESPNFMKDQYFLSEKTSVPHPFIIDPPLDNKTYYQPKESLSFSMVLIGRAINYLPFIIILYKKGGKEGIGPKRAKFKLCKVNLVGFGEKYSIYDIESDRIKLQKNKINILQRLTDFRKDLRQIKISFLTPTRIKRKGRLIKIPFFSDIIRAILIRALLLSNFHCSKKVTIDLNEELKDSELIKINQVNLKWIDWKHYSPRAKQFIKLGGFMGEISFIGEIGKWLKLLHLGEELHIGNGTSFGLGKYKIYVEDENVCCDKL